MQQNQESEDMKSLRKFWHWADNERPSRELFDAKATAGGPLTEEAQEAMQQAVEVVSLRAPDCLHPSGEVLRPAIKVLSLAILQAWELLKENPMIVEALEKQETRDFSVQGRLTAYFDMETLKLDRGIIEPPRPKLTSILGRLEDFADGEEITMTSPDGSQRKGTLHHQGMGVYDFEEHVGKAKDIIASKTVQPGVFRSNEFTADAVGYQQYNMRIPGEFLHVDIKPLTIIPPIGESGFTRSIEDSFFEERMKKLIQMEDNQAARNVNVRVDSRGIWISSKDFPDIGMLCEASEFETRAGNGSIDTHKLYLLLNTLRRQVIDRKMAQ